jgi:hypothetical protein
MPSAWRVVRAARVKSAFNGEGGRIYGGRWNSAALERGTADVPNDANRRRMGSRGKVRRPCSPHRAECERDELFVKSQASGFQKNQNQSAGRVPIRFAAIESLTIR